ncbi:hypothetical protein JS562_40085 [Agrobacterium sp. S2]|nr:hypothetical protein [Agrobacterium sp. S2]
MASENGGAGTSLSVLRDPVPMELDGRTGWLAQWAAAFAWSAMLPR